ncbi:MAG: ACP phosphodiesterase [Prevotellaceae bacterium]|nr:ACP phosphodiesterase [Prevotellaceae bacterium]
MNYLAHILLSGDNAQRRTGGFIADLVKGSRLSYLPNEIRQGIVLHRRIDTFTDAHPLAQEARALLRPYFGRYAGVFLDVFYDYFLAKNWKTFSDVSLTRFALSFYVAMLQSYRWLPLLVKSFAWHFILTNRLGRYAHPEGIRRTLQIMASYSSLPQMSREAVEILRKHEKELEQNFMQLFPQLQAYSREEIKIIELRFAPVASLTMMEHDSISLT